MTERESGLVDSGVISEDGKELPAWFRISEVSVGLLLLNQSKEAVGALAGLALFVHGVAGDRALRSFFREMGQLS